MEEIVEGVNRVTAIMREIASAGAEQKSGIGQIKQAIVQMDSVTQQNAARSPAQRRAFCCRHTSTFAL